MVRFDYDPALVAAVKGLPHRRFDAATKEWVVPVRYYLDAAVALEGAGATVTFDAELARWSEEGKVPPAQRPRASVGRTGGHFVVRFPYEPKLVAAVKGIPGRTFDPSAKAWFVPAEAPRMLEVIVDTLEAAGAEVDVEQGLLALAD